MVGFNKMAVVSKNSLKNYPVHYFWIHKNLSRILESVFEMTILRV